MHSAILLLMAAVHTLRAVCQGAAEICRLYLLACTRCMHLQVVFDYYTAAGSPPASLQWLQICVDLDLDS